MIRGIGKKPSLNDTDVWAQVNCADIDMTCQPRPALRIGQEQSARYSDGARRWSTHTPDEVEVRACQLGIVHVRSSAGQKQEWHF